MSITITTKLCPCCGQTKSTDEFHNDINRKDGLGCYCKECNKLYRQRYHKTNNRNRKKEATELFPKTKWCPKCKTLKSELDFAFMSKSMDGLQSQCKDCSNKKNRTIYKQRGIQNKYGITEDKYDELLKLQNGVCALCGKTPEANGKLLSVDHNHKTFKIRGLLCNKCNIGIGHFNDDSNLMRKVADYLDA